MKTRVLSPSPDSGEGFCSSSWVSPKEEMFVEDRRGRNHRFCGVYSWSGLMALVKSSGKGRSPEVKRTMALFLLDTSGEANTRSRSRRASRHFFSDRYPRAFQAV